MKRCDRGFASLLSILLTLIIICILLYIMSKTYLQKFLPGEKIEGIPSAQVLKNSNYKSVIDFSKNKLKDIDKQRTEQLESLPQTGK